MKQIKVKLQRRGNLETFKILSIVNAVFLDVYNGDDVRKVSTNNVLDASEAEELTQRTNVEVTVVSQ